MPSGFVLPELLLKDAGVGVALGGEGGEQLGHMLRACLLYTSLLDGVPLVEGVGE